MNKNNHILREGFVFQSSDFLPLIYLIDQDRRRACRLVDFLSSEGFKVQFLSSPPDLNNLNLDKNNFPVFLWNVEKLNNFTSSLAKKAKKQYGQISIIIMAPPDETKEILLLIREGLVDQLVSPDHWPALLSAIQSEIQKESYRRQLIQKSIELRQIKQSKEKTALQIQELEAFIMPPLKI